MKRTIVSLMAVAFLAGCSKPGDVPVPAGDGAIRIFTGIEASSKTVVTQDVGLTGAMFMKVDGSAEPSDFSAVISPVSGNVAASTGEVSFVSAPTYNPDNSHAYMIAYYPAGNLAAGAVTWSVDGQTDILRTDAVWDAGTYASPNTGASGAQLTMNHQLSQVEVICKSESGPDVGSVRAAWGKITKIEFIDAPVSMVYTLNGLTVANGRDVADFAMLADYNGTAFSEIDIPDNGNASANAVAMLAPVAPTAGASFVLRVTASGDGVTPVVQTVGIGLGSAKEAMVKGKIHKVTLTFKSDGRNISTAVTTIEGWTYGSEGSSDIEKP